MSVPPDRFARISGRLDLSLLAKKLVVIVGVGSVGSQLAELLADSGVGRLRLFDGKPLSEHNLGRHALTNPYVGQNKATGIEAYFAQEVPTLECEGYPWDLSASLPDELIDEFLQDANLIIAATDDREVQRMIGRRALALDIPAIFPGLYERNGGEVFVQRSPRWPCFFCRDWFRPASETLRGVSATNQDILGIIALAARLSLGILDPSSEYLQRLMSPSAGEAAPPQLFVDNGLGLARRTVPRRKGCPSCAVGPSSLRPDAVEAWEAAEARRPGGVTTTAPAVVAQPPAPIVLPRSLAWIAAGIALLIVALVLANSGGHSTPTSTSSTGLPPPPEMSRAESEAQQEAKYRTLAEARIAQLSFKCLERHACHADPEGHPLPIFIDGMDENLREYLEQHGYRDQWTDSAGGIDGQTIGPARYVGQAQTIAYLAKAPEAGMPVDEVDTGASFGSGLTYHEIGEHESMETGVDPWDVSGGESWTITWTLKGPSDQVVRQLQYSVNVVRCGGAAASYCEQVKDYDPNEPANKIQYTPPSAFPRDALPETAPSESAAPVAGEANLGALKGVTATQLNGTTVEISWENPHDPTVWGFIINENSPESESSGANTGPDPDGTSITEDTATWAPQFRPKPGQLWQFCVAPFSREQLNGDYITLPNRESCTQQARWH